jgi:hypothetical protein
MQQVLICNFSESITAETIKGIIKELDLWIGDDFELGSVEMSTDEMFVLAREIVERGLNVMILNRSDGYLLGIDTQRFQQR